MERLVVEGVSKSFPTGFFRSERLPVLQDVSFSLAVGRTLGLVGMSGSGKSTLARILTGLIRPDSGKILFEGNELTKLTRSEWRKQTRDLQMLFQHPTSALNPRFTLAESMYEPLRLHPNVLPREQWGAEVRKQLDFVALSPGLLTRYPHELSGGQLQRFCLARLLLLRPKLIVLDEPTSMLDVSVQALVMDELMNAQREWDISYIFISHDLDLVRAYSDEIAVMHEGKILERQTAEDLYREPQTEYTRRLIAAFSELS